jgi:hypothetical protein
MKFFIDTANIEEIKKAPSYRHRYREVLEGLGEGAKK